MPVVVMGSLLSLSLWELGCVRQSLQPGLGLVPTTTALLASLTAGLRLPSPPSQEWSARHWRPVRLSVRVQHGLPPRADARVEPLWHTQVRLTIAAVDGLQARDSKLG